ncbi:hypothetical protein D1B31_20580 [Neobacillus notoginsengisoli]|uniref:Flagellar protein FliT n=1 Tax=Neobacillus notoginsengisoli TaxID=1578198 RepID=A0A417YJG9_9BACI|nr:hypothetical protein D1B31_20580 [Neobacillus notoginsengisoli]
MLEEKNAMLRKFGKLSEKLLDALKNGSDDEVPMLLEQREFCISAINKLQEASGTLLTNSETTKLLNELVNKEEELEKRFSKTLQKMSRSIHAVRNEQYVARQYDEWNPVSSGYFYDQRK